MVNKVKRKLLKSRHFFKDKGKTIYNKLHLDKVVKSLKKFNKNKYYKQKR